MRREKRGKRKRQRGGRRKKDGEMTVQLMPITMRTGQQIVVAAQGLQRKQVWK